MADPKNKWSQPVAPPAPMFFGEKERDLVKQVNDELAERVVGQTIAYYPISIEDSNFNDLYGEAIEKVSLPPVRVFAYVTVENEQVNDRYSYEYKSKLTVNFHRKRLVADQNLYVRVGDFIQYGDEFYEIVRTYNDTRYYFGQVQHKFQITADCITARAGNFQVMPAVDRPVDQVSIDPVDGSTRAAPRSAPYPPVDADYLTLTRQPRVTNSRFLVAGTGITFTDGGRLAGLTIAASGQNAVGMTGSIQYQTGAGTFSGSANLVFLTSSNALSVTGDITASANMSASAYYGDGSNLSGITTGPAGSDTQVQYNDGGSMAGSSNLTFNGTTITGSYTGSLAQFTTLSASLMNLVALSGTLAGTGSYLGLDSSNNFVLTSAASTGGGTPGGSDTQVQFNDGGSFGGSSNLVFDGSTLTLAGNAIATRVSASSGVSGSAVQGGTISSDGAITGGSLTDGTATITAGAISGGTSYSGSTTIQGASVAVDGAVTGGSLTDGTATITSGAGSGFTTFVGTQLSGSTGVSGSALQGGRLTVSGYSVRVEGTSQLNQDLTTDASPTFTGATLSGLTATRLAATDGSSALSSTSLNSWVAGTSNQVSVADDGDGTITLSTPQSIDTSATVEFARVSGSIGVSGSAIQGGASTLASLAVSDLTSGRVVLAGTSGELEDNGNLTFDGTSLTVTGDLTASVNVSASAFYGDGSNLTGIATTTTGGIFTAIDGSNAYVTSSLNIGGTSTPGAQLQVSSSGDENLFQVDGATAGTTLFVTGSGRVGIGTATPGYLLEVSGGDVSILSTNPGAGTANPPNGRLLFDKVFDNSGEHTANKIVLYDDGGVGASWKGGIGVSSLSVDFYSGDKFNFWTDHGSAQQGDNRFTILTNGNVGIGTDAPNYPLEVAGTVGIDDYIYHNGDGDTYLKFATDEVNLVAGGKSVIKLAETGTNDKILINNTNADIDLQVMADDGSVILHTDAGANRVGINTDDPTYTLDVAGDAGFNEYIYHNGDTNTYIQFGVDQINLVAGAVEMIYINEGGARPPRGQSCN